MATTTSRFGITKHVDADPFVTEEIAANWQTIDNRAQGWLPPDTIANRPAPSASIAGFLFWAYDSGLVFICVDTGGGYAWKNTGTTDHGDTPPLVIDDAEADHPQYLPSASHEPGGEARNLHKSLNFDAVAINGVDLASMAAAQVYFQTETTNASTTISNTNYHVVLSAAVTPPFVDGVASYKITAVGIAFFEGNNIDSLARGRVNISGSLGSTSSIRTGFTDLAVMASNEVGGLSAANEPVDFYVRDDDADAVVKSASLFIAAIRQG